MLLLILSMVLVKLVGIDEDVLLVWFCVYYSESNLPVEG